MIGDPHTGSAQPLADATGLTRSRFIARCIA
jgi:hypothetical protein